MKNWKKITLIIVAVVAAIGIYKAYHMYTDGPERYVDRKAISVNAMTLMDEYSKSETNANKKYLDKVVAVNGEIKDITKDQEGHTIVILKTSDPMNNINCTLDQKDPTINAGSVITLKGLCTGYMMDVYLKGCTVVK